MNNSEQHRVLIYAIRGTEDWWKSVGNHLNIGSSYVVSDIKGQGDFNVVEDFYKAYNFHKSSEKNSSDLLDVKTVNEILARCRVLRCLDRKTAIPMALAMADAFEIVLKHVKPTVILSFPIDRYVSDVLEYLARAHGIPYFELTVSPLPGMAMLTRKGTLFVRDEDPVVEMVDDYVARLVKTSFVPAYAQGISNFSLLRFLKIFFYWRIRGFAFKLISLVKRDPLNLHYLDSQAFLEHKVTLRDSRILKLCDYGWREKLADFKSVKTVLFGLTVFPEASIDYWVKQLDLIKYEEMMLEAAQVFSRAGYLVLVKDHPQQFGFRKKGFVEQLVKLKNVIFLPYEVSANEVLSICDTNFTCTGTLGLQSALIGKTSIAIKNYYSLSGDFVHYTDLSGIAKLPLRPPSTISGEKLKLRQRRIVSNLLKGSFECDFFSFQSFKPKVTSPAVGHLGIALGKELKIHLKNIESGGS